MPAFPNLALNSYHNYFKSTDPIGILDIGSFLEKVLDTTPVAFQ